ncbi:MAG: hypothetical protein O2840_04690 [bacterium]|nr:hypothetical protein [bacterium]
MSINGESVNQLKQVDFHTTNRISWKTIAIISLSISGLLFLIIFTLIAKKPMLLPQIQKPLLLEIAEQHTPQNVATPKPSSQETKEIDKFTYPSDVFFLSEGEATVKSLRQDSELDKVVVELTLRHFRTTEEKSYTILMPPFDYIGEPKISFQEKYGCFSVSTSGYTGYYIFKIQDGKQIDTGKQYSNCVTWIDDHRVIVADKPYDNPEQTSFYILNTETNTKQIISSPLQ